MNASRLKMLLSPFCKIRYHLFHVKGNIYVGHDITIRKPKNCHFTNRVNISPFCLLIAWGDLSLEEKVYIGYYSEIMCCHKIVIGKNTICGPYMFITDYNHEYRNPDIPISEQGAPKGEENNEVMIGADSWIGAHATIMGNVHTGKHCVVGGQIVFVNKDI
jgi:acetyltransferase-like isoleucine patch superfamily enzyme